MMTIEEIETACDTSQALDFSRHELAGPELTFKQMFYPYGFPAEVRTNSPQVLRLCGELWGSFDKQQDTKPISAEVSVIDDGSEECPPTPGCQIILPLVVSVADSNNYSIVNHQQNSVQTLISRAALKHELYAKYFFLSMPVCCVAATPIHAACVSLDGRGVLLCGDSGAGKSTLSYACARTGWTYTTDDSSYLLNSGTKRHVIGNCGEIRFRPSAAELFPEIRGLEITPRAAGKPSIELPTETMPHMALAQSAKIDFIVFLNRCAGPAEIMPYRRDVARYFMQQQLYGLPKSLAVQNEAIEHLLSAEIFQLQYNDMDRATDRLRMLVQEGR